MVHSLQAGEKRASEGFGTMGMYLGDAVEDNRNSHDLSYAEGAEDFHHSKRVSFMPLFGICSQDKLLPSRYALVQIELGLVNSGSDAVQVSSEGGRICSSSWVVSDVQCKCDLLTLGNAPDNEYASHLLSGKSLPINSSTWNHSHQATGSDANFSARINRSLIRLKSLFVIFNHKENAGFKHIIISIIP